MSHPDPGEQDPDKQDPDKQPDEREPADFDRVFAEMTAQWTVGESDPLPPSDAAQEPRPSGSAWASEHPLFRRDEPAEPEPLFRYQEPAEPEPAAEVDDGWFERPEVSPIPWGSLSLPAVLGGALMTFTVGVLLLSVLGLRLPTLVGYLAVGSFVVGFGLLMTRLRRSGDTDPGHGAQL